MVARPRRRRPCTLKADGERRECMCAWCVTIRSKSRLPTIIATISTAKISPANGATARCERSPGAAADQRQAAQKTDRTRGGARKQRSLTHRTAGSKSGSQTGCPGPLPAWRARPLGSTLRRDRAAAGGAFEDDARTAAMCVRGTNGASARFGIAEKRRRFCGGSGTDGAKRNGGTAES